MFVAISGEGLFCGRFGPWPIKPIVHLIVQCLDWSFNLVHWNGTVKLKQSRSVRKKSLRGTQLRNPFFVQWSINKILCRFYHQMKSVIGSSIGWSVNLSTNWQTRLPRGVNTLTWLILLRWSQNALEKSYKS